MTKQKQIAEVDFNEATYVGDETDGVYVQAAAGKGGWYVSNVVDCNSSGFVEPLHTDDGPYKTEAEAMIAGISGALDWCADNQIEHDLKLPVTWPVSRWEPQPIPQLVEQLQQLRANANLSDSEYQTLGEAIRRLRDGDLS